MLRYVRAGGAAALLLVVGCGSWGRVGAEPPPPDPRETLTQTLDMTAVYRRLGRLVSNGAFPFVGDLAFFGGPGDSAIAVAALSLENRNFAFMREGGSFAAHYVVTVTATPAAGGTPVVVTKKETARVGTFAETSRSAESILHQEGLTLTPGMWQFAVEVTDEGAGRTGRAEALVRVPAFPEGSLSPPRLAYQVKGRGSRAAPVAVILNPRGTLAYGGDTAAVYVEGYGIETARDVPVLLRDATDSVVLREFLRFQGGHEVESHVLRFVPTAASLGRLQIVVGEGAAADSTTAIVSFSQQWAVTNFTDLLSLLRYFTPSPALDSLRKAPPEDRGTRWKAFWAGSDPNPATTSNEALEQYFGRLAAASQRFREEGVPGWRTDRGEVLIRLGEPDEIFDASPQSEGRIIRWGYIQLQLTLYFQDQTGFGRFDLTPASRSDFERVVARVSRQSGQ